MISNRSKKLKIICSLTILFTIAVMPLMGISDSSVQAAEPPEEIEELQQWVYDQDYNYTVAENWITRLSPEERETLCGYKHIEAPKEPLSKNVGFSSDVPKVGGAKIGSLPPSYDAMALGYVTPIKNQICGACWLHAAIADFESDIAIGESNLLDFSEQEVGDCNIWASVGGHDFCSGGIALMTTNYFTKYGSADETCHPYAATPQTCYSCPLLKNVDNWRMITGDDGNELYHINTIKNAILNYGPVYSSIYASGPGFDGYEGGVYEYWGTEDTDHAIEIIGWDDSLSHSHGTGAWMIKNSWATSWGASGPYPGCAWVAYDAANLGDYTSAISGYQNPDDTIFYHDECGWMYYSWGYSPSTTAYGAVRFTPTQDSTLTAVDFWAVDPNMNYEIKIFDTLNDLGGGNYTFSSQLGTTQTGSTKEKGYYSLPLNTPVSLISGDDFIVQVKLTTTGYGYPIPIDYCTISWLPSWSGIATFSGESYESWDGTQFTKPYDSYLDEYFDVGIRARAQLPGVPPSVTTNDATNITTNSATLNGTLTSLGSASSVSVSFEWGTTTAYGHETTPQVMTATGAFSFNLGSLNSDTTYHFRAKAVGDGNIVYGAGKSFVTPAVSMPKTIYVDDDFTDDPANHQWDTIQEGIDDASDGDTIMVYGGTYDGFTVENKNNLSIIGQDGVIVNNANWFEEYGYEWWAMAYVKNSTNISIEHIVFDGGEIEVSMIEGVAWGDSTGSITDVTVRNMVGSEMAMGVCIWGTEEDTTALDISQLTVENCIMGIWVENAETNFDSCSIKGMAPDGGYGIMAVDNAQVTMENCEISDCWKEAPAPGEAGLGVMIGMPPEYEEEMGIEDGRLSTVMMTGCTIFDNNIGISVYDNGDLIANFSNIAGNDILGVHNSGQVEMTHCIISNNKNGIHVGEGGDLVANFNNIVGNDDFGICKENPPSVDATDNWWGDASGPYNESTNPDGQGNAVSDNVNFAPWLTQEWSPWDPWGYDENSDGEIQKSEAIQAVVDYFDGTITKEQAIEVVLLYFG